MNIADYILIALVLTAFIAALVYIFKQRKAGNCFGCGGSCKNCNSCSQIITQKKKGL